jgi:tRNA (uracil-5-)-methyltransferase TRM9
MYTTKEIYNIIADEFNLYRVTVWPCVSNFLSRFNSNDLLLDIGCGNGKNIIGNNHLNFKGIDFSDKLVSICKAKNMDVIEASMTSIPYDDNMFDGFIAVASYHHLDNDNDRMKTLNEMYRILKPGAKGLIVVWAMEQGVKTKFKFTKEDEMVLWKSRSGNIYERYYHIYKKHDLINEIQRLEPRFKIIYEGWEEGNWYVYVEK